MGGVDAVDHRGDQSAEAREEVDRCLPGEVRAAAGRTQPAEVRVAVVPSRQAEVRVAVDLRWQAEDRAQGPGRSAPLRHAAVEGEASAVAERAAAARGGAGVAMPRERVDDPSARSSSSAADDTPRLRGRSQE
jgi:hypothetical protein